MMLDIKTINTKMMMKIRLSFVYIFADVVLIIFSFFMGGLWLINTQVAFICSMLIVFASFLSYKGMIEKRLESGDLGDDRDLLDQIDDKYELFDDEKEIAQDLSAEEFKELYKEERAKLGGAKRSFFNLVKSWSGALSIFRLLSYGILFVAILFLIRKELFEPIAFLVGIGFSISMILLSADLAYPASTSF